MSNIDKYTNFIAEQVRKGSVAGLRTGVIAEATEKTAVKHELKNLNDHLGGEVVGSQRTGRGAQTTSPRIDVSHHKTPEQIHKALTAAGYKPAPKPSKFYSDNDKFYEKKDQHGYTHTLAHSGPSVHHIGASAS
jgi:hypothetical protein